MQTALKPHKIDPHKINYRPWLILFALLIVFASVLFVLQLRSAEEVTAPVTWPAQGWQSTTPESQGIDSAILAQALLDIRQHEINIHSLLIIRHGLTVVDAYFYPYDGSTVHDLASVTKSIMPSLLAIAAEQGKLELDAPVLSFFADREIANRDALKERMTIRHLASMSNGLESVCKENDEGTLAAMVATSNWMQFSLDRKMTHEPGSYFCYDSPGMHLLSGVLQQATGMTALEFARRNLFTPLGIENVLWESDAQGYNDGWGDIYLHPHDMAKIGYLWLHGGEWQGKQIISRQWIEASVTPQMTETREESVYGYGWWLERGDSLAVYSASGRGGQAIKVIPAFDLVVVTTGGGFEYDDIDPFITPSLVDTEAALPANAAGVAQLQAAVAAVAQPPAPQSPVVLPDQAKEISGRNVVFEPNPTGIRTARLEFKDGNEAIFHTTFYPTLLALRPPARVPVGLDGVYRLSAGDHGLPQGHRAQWVDAGTLIIEYDNIANNDHIFYTVAFEGNRVLLSVQETAHEGSLQVEGQFQGAE